MANDLLAPDLRKPSCRGNPRREGRKYVWRALPRIESAKSSGQQKSKAMSAMIRFENMHPFKELEEIGERFNRLFGRLPVRRDSGQEALTMADWVPRVDITEDDKEYLIKAEIPEVDKKDAKVTVQEGVLTIQGERKREKEENNKRVHRIERFYGTFVRSFSLPEDVDEDNLKAEFKDGMLLVHLPKAEKPKPKAVEIQVQ